MDGSHLKKSLNFLEGNEIIDGNPQREKLSDSPLGSSEDEEDSDSPWEYGGGGREISSKNIDNSIKIKNSKKTKQIKLNDTSTLNGLLPSPVLGNSRIFTPKQPLRSTTLISTN